MFKQNKSNTDLSDLEKEYYEREIAKLRDEEQARRFEEMKPLYVAFTVILLCLAKYLGFEL